jgi:dihydrodipicolinate synthase/N-acetylneuraminate lyase
MKTFTGMYPIVNTPFNDNGTLDLVSQHRLRTRVILQEVDGTIPVLVNSGYTGTDVAVMKQHLRDAGVISPAPTRHPIRTLDATDVAEVRSLRTELDLFAFRRAAAQA